MVLQYSTVWWVKYSTVQYSTVYWVHYSAVQYTEYSTLQYSILSTVPYSTVQYTEYITVQYSLLSTLQCSTVHWIQNTEYSTIQYWLWVLWLGYDSEPSRQKPGVATQGRKFPKLSPNQAAIWLGSVVFTLGEGDCLIKYWELKFISDMAAIIVFWENGYFYLFQTTWKVIYWNLQ